MTKNLNQEREGKPYAFPQQGIVSTFAVAPTITRLLNLGIARHHILDIYLDAQKFKAIQNHKAENDQSPITHPYKYMAAVNTLTKEQREVTHYALEQAYDQALLDWSTVSPLDFLLEFAGYFANGPNDSGIENGMIAERLLATLPESAQLLIIDPSPSFLRFMSQSPKWMRLAITIAFEDTRMARICQLHPWPLGISVLSVDDLFKQQLHYRTAFIMAGSADYHHTVALLGKMKSAGVHTLFLLAPSVFFDYKQRNGPLRRSTAHEWDLRQMILITIEHTRQKSSKNQEDNTDEATTKKKNASKDSSGATKRVMLVMLNKPPSGDPIMTEHAKRARKKLVSSTPVAVPHSKFAECRTSLGTLYNWAVKQAATSLVPTSTIEEGASKPPPRQPSEPVPFSPEIILSVRVESVRKGTESEAYRLAWKYYGYPHAKQLRRNESAHGKLIAEGKGPSKPSPEQAKGCFNSIILPTDGESKFIPGALAAIICETVLSQYGTTTPLSLKTFWFALLPTLLAKESYSHALCCKVFLSSRWNEFEICSTIVDDKDLIEEPIDPNGKAKVIPKAEQIQSAVLALVAKDVLSNTEAQEFLLQLKMIWDQYVNTHPGHSNPLIKVISESEEFQDHKELQREMLARRSWTLDQMQTLSELIDSQITYVPMALAVKCKLLLGLSYGEVAALTIADLRHSGQELSITKFLPQTGASSVEYVPKASRQLQPWNIRTTPVPSDLARQLYNAAKETKDLLFDLYGLDPNSCGAYPLFPSEKKPNHPILTRRIQEECRRLVAMLNAPPLVINCPDDGIETNIHDYSADKWLANWRYQARYRLGMDSGTAKALIGSKPDLVSDINYRDFSHHIQKRGLQILLEKLAFAIKHAGERINTAVMRASLVSKKKRIPYTQYAEANELIITFANTEVTAVELDIDAPHGCYVEISHE